VLLLEKLEQIFTDNLAVATRSSNFRSFVEPAHLIPNNVHNELQPDHILTLRIAVHIHSFHSYIS